MIYMQTVLYQHNIRLYSEEHSRLQQTHQCNVIFSIFCNFLYQYLSTIFILQNHFRVIIIYEVQLKHNDTQNIKIVLTIQSCFGHIKGFFLLFIHLGKVCTHLMHNNDKSVSFENIFFSLYFNFCTIVRNNCSSQINFFRQGYIYSICTL